MEALDKINDEKRKLIFAIKSQNTPNVICININQYQDQNETLDWFKKEFTQQHFVFDVTLEQVDSLFEKLLAFSLNNKDKINPLDFVHVIGLENSISHFVNNQAVDLPLIANMNYERENFFRRLPFHTVLWGNAYFFKQLHLKAPDFMHWVTLSFDFSKPIKSNDQESVFINESPKPLGNIPERTQHIKDLEAQYEKLNLDASDTKRLFKDKLTLLEALGTEYKKQQNYLAAQNNYEKALAIAEKLKNDEDLAKIHFELSYVYLSTNLLEKSLYFSKLSTKYCEKYFLDNLDACYHQLGMIYQEQNNFELAYLNYEKSIEWKKKFNKHNEIGVTFHQIGVLHQNLKNWSKAITYYHMAIAWKEKSKNFSSIGCSYHNIGMVYEEQKKWDTALFNYRLAIEWHEKSENYFELGISYNNIGNIYHNLKMYEDAEKYYLKAVFWKKKSGNIFELGETYHQLGLLYQNMKTPNKAITLNEKALKINYDTNKLYDLGDTYINLGSVYQEQKEWQKSKENYEKAIELLEKFNHPNLKIAKESLEKLINTINNQTT